MATTWKVTADSVPVLDGWGWADYWPIDTWVEWHRTMKAKYGLTQANRRFVYYWNQQSAGANPLDARIWDSNFKQYAKENALFDSLFGTTGGWIARALTWPAELFKASDKVVTGTTGAIGQAADGIGATGKLLKYALPAAVILILAAGAFYLYNNSKR